MREKTQMLIVTFHTTAAAMAMEKYCTQAEIPGRLMPVPRAITSDCGIAWCAPCESRAAIEELVRQHRLEVAGYFEHLL